MEKPKIKLCPMVAFGQRYFKPKDELSKMLISLCKPRSTKKKHFTQEELERFKEFFDIELISLPFEVGEDNG